MYARVKNRTDTSDISSSFIQGKMIYFSISVYSPSPSRKDHIPGQNIEEMRSFSPQIPQEGEH